MDTATQVLLGVATSEVGFRRRLGRPANWLAAASALLPDLDYLLRPIDGEWSFISIHRGHSHSFAFCLIAAFPLAWLFRRAFKSDKSYWLFWGCSLAALVSHPLLDLCTSYGTRVLLPLSGRWFAWDIVGIIDAVYTGLLAGALVACVLARRRGRPVLGHWIAAGGLVLSTAYLGLGAYCHARAIVVMRAAAEEAGERAVRVEAFPMIGTVAVWRAVAETEDAFLVGKVCLPGEATPRLTRLPKAEGGLIPRALSHERVRQFSAFARGLIRPIQVDARTVEFDDMRYGFPADSPRSIWGVRVEFSEDGETTRARVVRRSFRALREEVLR